MPMLIVDWAKYCLLISSWGAGHLICSTPRTMLRASKTTPSPDRGKEKMGPGLHIQDRVISNVFTLLQNAPPSRNFAWHTLASIELVPNSHL